jgi:predicted RNase H-like HicB family nuclease
VSAAEEGGYWATCPEIPGANGQGKTVSEAKRNLAQAIRLLTEDQELDALLSQITSENTHPEIEVGKLVGKEIW